MLHYVPLEGYQERYTSQMSAPVTGWFEREWIGHKIPYRRISGKPHNTSIKTGQVLDAVGRSLYSFSQVEQLLVMLEHGYITDDDVIYFDDFWHPGIEAIPYAAHLLGKSLRMYAFLWAQSVDEYDFTYPMRHWMRHFERGIGEVLTGIFVCCPTLKELVAKGGIAPEAKVHVVGLPFCSKEAKERMLQHPQERQNTVIYSSRWDKEKNPWFFVDVAKEVGKQRPATQFVICTGAKQLRSNDESLLSYLYQAQEECPNIVVKENLTKELYYRELCQAKVQFNCADQDFVSFTLLEATTAGCYPIYPDYRSFPETFLGHGEYLYPRLNKTAAVNAIIGVLDQGDLWSDKEVAGRSWIYKRFDTTWQRMLKVMGEWKGEVSDPFAEQAGD